MARGRTRTPRMAAIRVPGGRGRPGGTAAGPGRTAGPGSTAIRLARRTRCHSGRRRAGGPQRDTRSRDQGTATRPPADPCRPTAAVLGRRTCRAARPRAQTAGPARHTAREAREATVPALGRRRHTARAPGRPRHTAREATARAPGRPRHTAREATARAPGRPRHTAREATARALGRRRRTGRIPGRLRDTGRTGRVAARRIADRWGRTGLAAIPRERTGGPKTRPHPASGRSVPR